MVKISNNADSERERVAMRVSGESIVINTFLSLFKVISGAVAHSGAMISDGVHSASDVFSTVIVMIGVRFAGKKADEEHPYGHERLECVAAIILATILLVTGLSIGSTGIGNLTAAFKGQLEIPVPGTLALVAAVVSVVIKEAMFWRTRAAAKRIRSDALMANAWHHRSDAFSSVGSFAGILGARMGFSYLDSVASVIICVFILRVAVEIFIDAIRKMMDESCDRETVERMKQVIVSQEGVHGIDVLKSRMFGSRIYIDVEIRADGSMTLNEAHGIAQQVHDAIERKFPDVKHCMVHVNPDADSAANEP